MAYVDMLYVVTAYNSYGLENRDSAPHAYVAIACIVIACVVMAYVVIAYIVMPSRTGTRLCMPM